MEEIEKNEKMDLESFECFYNRFLREHKEDIGNTRSAMYWGWICRHYHDESIKSMNECLTLTKGR